MYTNQTTISKDEFVARARRQAARAALLHPGRSDAYYDHYRQVLRETAPGGTAATPQRMEKRTPAARTATVRPVKRSAPAPKRKVIRTRAEKIQSMLEVLQVCDRSEVQIRSYPLARRLRHQRSIAELRAKAKANLRKLGYTNV